MRDVPRWIRSPCSFSRTRMRLFLRPVVLLIGCLLIGGLGSAAPSPLSAQPDQAAASQSGARRPDDGMAFLASNALLAGMGAGISQAVRGGSFVKGFLGGVLGGVVAYSGRGIAAQRFDGAGLLGRQVGALGASLTRNVSEGEPALGHILFPVGPLNLHLHRDQDRTHLSIKLNAVATALAGFLAFSDHAHFDWESSFSSGAFVFRSDRSFLFRESERVAGETFAHTIILIDDVSPDLGQTLAHERVHLLQSDFAFHVLGRPLEGWLAGKHPLTRRADEIVDLDLLVPSSFWTLDQIFRLDPEDRLTEQEAVFLAGG